MAMYPILSLRQSNWDKSPSLHYDYDTSHEQGWRVIMFVEIGTGCTSIRTLSVYHELYIIRHNIIDVIDTKDIEVGDIVTDLYGNGDNMTRWRVADLICASERDTIRHGQELINILKSRVG